MLNLRDWFKVFKKYWNKKSYCQFETKKEKEHSS